MKTIASNGTAQPVKKPVPGPIKKPAPAAVTKPAPAKAPPPPKAAAPAAKPTIPKDRATKPQFAQPKAAPAPAKKTVKVTAPVEVEVEVGEEEVSEIDVTEARQEAEEDFQEEDATDAEEQEAVEDTREESPAEGEESEIQGGEEEGQEVEEAPAEEEVAEEEEAPTEEEEEEEEEQAPPPPPKKTAQAKQAPAPAKKQIPAITQSRAIAAAPAKQAGSSLKGDLVLPRLLLMQDTSELVKARKAYSGQIVRSTSGECLGGVIQPDEPAKSIQVIPLAMKNSWTVRHAKGFKWVRNEAREEGNDNLPYEFNEGGLELKRYKTIELMALVLDDVLANVGGGGETDEEGVLTNLDSAVLMPQMISFVATSFGAGKMVSTHFAKVNAAALTHPLTKPFHFTLELGVKQQSGKDGSWFVFDVTKTAAAPKATREAARHWYEQIQANNVEAEGEDVAEAQAGQNLKARPKAKPGAHV